MIRLIARVLTAKANHLETLTETMKFGRLLYGLAMVGAAGGLLLGYLDTKRREELAAVEGLRKSNRERADEDRLDQEEGQNTRAERLRTKEINRVNMERSFEQSGMSHEEAKARHARNLREFKREEENDAIIDAERAKRPNVGQCHRNPPEKGDLFDDAPGTIGGALNSMFKDIAPNPIYLAELQDDARRFAEERHSSEVGTVARVYVEELAARTASGDELAGLDFAAVAQLLQAVKPPAPVSVTIDCSQPGNSRVIPPHPADVKTVSWCHRCDARGAVGVCTSMVATEAQEEHRQNAINATAQPFAPSAPPAAPSAWSHPMEQITTPPASGSPWDSHAAADARFIAEQQQAGEEQAAPHTPPSYRTPRRGDVYTLETEAVKLEWTVFAVMSEAQIATLQSINSSRDASFADLDNANVWTLERSGTPLQQ